jgi:hypothetical protein
MRWEPAMNIASGSISTRARPSPVAD